MAKCSLKSRQEGITEDNAFNIVLTNKYMYDAVIKENHTTHIVYEIVFVSYFDKYGYVNQQSKR